MTAGVRLCHADDVSSRLRSPLLVLALAALGGSVALALALVIGAPLGADHSCPAGAPVTSCHYPPNTAAWLVEWGVGGVVVGLALAIVIVVRFLSPAGPRRHPMRPRHSASA